jgi:hypothetical protein
MALQNWSELFRVHFDDIDNGSQQQGETNREDALLPAGEKPAAQVQAS